MIEKQKKLTWVGIRMNLIAVILQIGIAITALKGASSYIHLFAFVSVILIGIGTALMIYNNDNILK